MKKIFTLFVFILSLTLLNLEGKAQCTAIITGPSNVCYGSIFSSSFNVSGVSNPLTYQWQYSTVGLNNWTNINISAGGTTNPFILNPILLLTPGSYDFRCLVTSSGCTGVIIGNSIIVLIEIVPIDNTITGITSITSGQQNVTYNVANQSPLCSPTYQWTVSGGAIVSGQNTNSIVVNWSSITSSDTVKLIETTTMGEVVTLYSYVNTTTTTPINISQENASIRFYPNPVKDAFWVDLPATGVNVQYSIVDISGSIVKTGSYISTCNAERIIADFPAGIYQLVMYYNNSSSSIRLSKI